MDTKAVRCLKIPGLTIPVVVDFVIWLIVGIPALYLYLRGIPQHSGFFCDDPSLSYPNKPDTLSTPLLCIVGFVTAVFLIVLVELLNCIENKCRKRCQKVTNIGVPIQAFFFLLVGFALEQMTVDAIKNLMGTPRPNFFDICRPRFNRTLCPGYILEFTCTNKEVNVKELRSVQQSFPSGHAAFAMYIATYLCFYIHRQLKIRFSHILKFALQFSLVLLAVLCGVGRIKDNKHHSSDVVFGLVIGLLHAVVLFKFVVEKVVMFDKVEVKLEESDPKSRQCSCQYDGRLLEEENMTSSPLLENVFFPSNNEQQTEGENIKTTDIV